MSERPLRIAFHAYRGNMRCGGQGVYLWHLARELARAGHRVDVFCGAPYPDPMPFVGRFEQIRNPQYWGKWFSRDRRPFLEYGVAAIFEPLAFYELGASWLGFLPEPFAFSVRGFRRIAGHLRTGDRWDVIHDVQSLGYGLLGLRRLGVPVVTTIHHPLTVDRRHSFVRDQTFADALGTMKFHPVGMQGFVARRLDAVITSSQESAREIIRDFRVRPERLHMLANGVDTEFFRPDPRVERRPGEVLCVGRAGDPTKGIDTLVDALALLPPNVRVRLVDDDHPQNRARGRARRLGCADRLEITGRLTNEALLESYRRASLVVVPSNYEGFGLPAVEAMACGTPVGASRAGALPEVVDPEGGGVLIPPRDAEALAKASRSLIEQPEARATLGARARASVVSRYGWPRIAAATVDVYREVTGRGA